MIFVHDDKYLIAMGNMLAGQYQRAGFAHVDLVQVHPVAACFKRIFGQDDGFKPGLRQCFCQVGIPEDRDRLFRRIVTDDSGLS